MRVLETDYLVVGAGASGMAFTDALLAASPDVDVVIVDRRDRPGGHWLDAYPFVRLHQPSAFYGVNSLRLGQDRIDLQGTNAGFYERATKAEICAYYEQVMDAFLASGRVRFLGSSEYRDEGADGHRIVSLLGASETEVRVRSALVDATYLEGEIPLNHTPPFEVEEDVRLIPPNDLVRAEWPATGYTVVGSGKTGMDTCVWLVENGVPADRIRWIKPRDLGGMNRATLQPLDQVASVIEGVAVDLESAAQAENPSDLFARLESSGRFLRVDPAVEPTMFRGATFSEAEVEVLRPIDDVVRMGRVRRLGTRQIMLEEGEVPAEPGHVYVDCTAAGLPATDSRPIFEEGRITIQTVRFGLTPFNAALVGYIEGSRDDISEKNRLCPPNTYPNRVIDWIPVNYVSTKAEMLWGAEPDLVEWLEGSRLNLAAGLRRHLGDPQVLQAIGRVLEHREPALANLERLMHHDVPRSLVVDR